MIKHRPQSLLQRWIEPEEIANMVACLASPLASATTGGALRVDGGYVDSILPQGLDDGRGAQWPVIARVFVNRVR